MDSLTIKWICDQWELPKPAIAAQYHISGLPTKIFQAILSKVPAHKLIPLRSVSKKWKVAIECVCIDKKCVVISTYWYKAYRSELSKQMNGHFKLLKDFVFIQLDYDYSGIYSMVQQSEQHNQVHLSAKLCTLLAKLFPRIEQFYVYAAFSFSTTEFKLMLRQWSSSLTTLSLYAHSSQIDIDLCDLMNDFLNLQQLNLNLFTEGMVDQLAPTFARLEHFSGWGWELTEQIVPLLGAGFTSLGYRKRVTIEDITDWRTLNAQFVSNLERFSLFTEEPQVLPFICEHFYSLQMLRMTFSATKLTTDMVQHLARLVHLTELQIDDIQIDLATLDVTQLVALHNIRILTLVDYKFVNGQSIVYFLPSNYEVEFGRVLSAIFPNVDNLTVKSVSYPQLGNLLKPHLNVFPTLRSFNLAVLDSIQHLIV